MDWQALLLSLKLALATTLFVLLIGLPLSFWSSQRPGRLAAAFDLISSIPLVLPPTVLGFYLLKILAPVGLAFSFTGLLIASVIYSFPYAIQPFLASFRGIDRGLFEVAGTLGARPLDTFFRVVLPLALPGILSGSVLCFAHTLGEFGVVLMIGGNIPGVTRTLSISIYDQIQVLDYESANRTAAFLLFVSVLALLIRHFLEKKKVTPYEPKY